MAKKLSRKKRLEKTIQNLSTADNYIENAKVSVEDLKSELEEWLDGMPENLQSGTKAEELQEAIDNLDELYNSLDEITGCIYTVQEESSNVKFPSMFG